MLLRNFALFLKHFPVLIRGVWMASFLLFFIGGGLNMLVISANDGKMPVPITVEGFFVIYPHYYWVALEATPDRMLIVGKARGYAVMTESSRFKILAGRFYLVSPINVYEYIPVWLTIRFIRSDIPLLGQEMQASIGDIIVWVADILILLAAFATIGFMLVRRFEYQMKRVQQNL